MKHLDAAIDNDAGKQIGRTRQVWQPRIRLDLTGKDAPAGRRQRHRPFAVVAEWSRAETLMRALAGAT